MFIVMLLIGIVCFALAQGSDTFELCLVPIIIAISFAIEPNLIIIPVMGAVAGFLISRN